MSDAQDPFLQALNAYKAAVYAKDVDAFAALYDDDVHVFDMWGAWSLRGIHAWRGMAAEWFSSLGTERVVVGMDQVEATENDGLLVGRAILAYTAMSAEGKELRSLNNRITMALKKTDGAWKIFHEHTSAPIDHVSTKAILRHA